MNIFLIAGRVIGIDKGSIDIQDRENKLELLADETITAKVTKGDLISVKGHIAERGLIVDRLYLFEEIDRMNELRN